MSLFGLDDVYNVLKILVLNSQLNMSNSRLFQPLKVGNATVQHRIAMAPLTRFRASDEHVPLPFVKEYYAQRASVPGTLIVSEATLISKQAGVGAYSNVPGIYSKEQIAAWKEVTDAVHEKKSFIYLQIWALGRVADPEATKKEGGEVKSASPIPHEEGATVPKELTQDEIKSLVAEYAKAARNAVEAGFDGVEIHGANGYLVDQFIQDNSNQRTDSYGGSIENRSRFAIEVATAVVDAVGAERTAIRLSPYSSFQGMGMKDPIPQFTNVVSKLKPLKLSYLHLVESRIDGNADTEATEKVDFAVQAWENTSPILLAGGFTPESAKRAANEEYKNRDIIIVFGRSFISTPDLPFRIQKGIPLTPYDRNKFYNAGEKDGYITWPFSKEFIELILGRGKPSGLFQNPAPIDPHTKTRSYVVNAYLGPDIKNRSNLVIITDTVVKKVLMEKRGHDVVATDVSVWTTEGDEGIKARTEVILAAGAFQSPQILELSGISDRKLLERHNIPVISENAHVGEYLQDHAIVCQRFEVNEGVPTGDLLHDPNVLGALVELYNKNGGAGPMSQSTVNCAYAPVADNEGVLPAEARETLLKAHSSYLGTII
ncbi:NADPH2 dehydrogenase [Seiridium cupressi]